MHNNGKLLVGKFVVVKVYDTKNKGTFLGRPVWVDTHEESI